MPLHVEAEEEKHSLNKLHMTMQVEMHHESVNPCVPRVDFIQNDVRWKCDGSAAASIGAKE